MEIVELTKNNMLDYAGAVNQARAIPDARTGLKPIHRKILYEMYTDKILSSGKYKKCAYMVGQVISRFSEHGDAATYDALVRLAQPWIQRYPLLDFHGNAGSQFGDPQASMRYTEAKLSKLSEVAVLGGTFLKKNAVEWMMNFTNEEKEPTTLPSYFPGLFCLPNQGIGYAVACNFLTMNLTEVCTALKKYIQTGEFDILQYDLASGGVIINPSVMKKIYETGKGTVVVECKYHIQKNKIIITELPFNVMFDDLMEEIVKVCEKEEYLGISNILNNSGAGKLEMIIEVSKGYEPEEVISWVFNKTKARSSYGVNQIALVNNKPKLLTQKNMAEIYVEHNLNTILKAHENDLGEASIRVEIFEGLVSALASIDKIVEIIRGSHNSSEAKEKLMSKYGFTERQTKAILDMKLAQLSKLDGVELKDKLDKEKEFVNYCKEVIDNKSKREEILCGQLDYLIEEFGDERRTKAIEKEIIKTTNAGKVKQAAVVENVVVVYNPIGYLQRVPVAQYKKTAHKGFKVTTADNILLFSNMGKVYRLAVKSIGVCGIKDKGTAIGSLIKLEQNEKILEVCSPNIDEKKLYIGVVTSNGLVKKTEKMELLGATQNLNGTAYIKCKNNEVVYVGEISGEGTLTLGTKNNMYIRFDMSTIKSTGKNSSGIRGISMTDEDMIEEVIFSAPDVKQVMTKHGIATFAIQGRGGKGKKYVK